MTNPNPRQRNVISVQGVAREEAGKCDVALKPGMLVEMGSSAKGWQPHSDAGGPALMVFVRENREDQGATHNKGGIDDAIAVGDAITVIFPPAGGKIFAPVTGTISRGDPLESAGNGELRLHGSGVILAYAADDSDDDTTGNAPLRCVVYVGVVGGAGA